MGPGLGASLLWAVTRQSLELQSWKRPLLWLEFP